MYAVAEVVLLGAFFKNKLPITQNIRARKIQLSKVKSLLLFSALFYRRLKKTSNLF